MSSLTERLAKQLEDNLRFIRRNPAYAVSVRQDALKETEALLAEYKELFNG